MNTQNITNQFLRTKNINGKSVSIYLLNAREGLDIGLKLGKIFAPALATASTTLEERGYFDHKMMAAQLIMNMDSPTVIDVITKLLRDVSVESADIVFDTYYRGNYAEMIDHLVFAMEANFTTFFVESISRNLSSMFNLMSDQQPQPEQEQQSQQV